MMKLLAQIAMNQVVIMNVMKNRGGVAGNTVLENSIRDTGTVMVHVMNDLRERADNAKA